MARLNHSPRVRIGISILFALWLLTAFAARLYIQLQGRDFDELAALIPILVIIWPPLFLLPLGYTLVPRSSDSISMLLLSAFILIAGLSCIVSPIPVQSLGFLLATVAAIYIALLFNNHLGPREVLASLRVYAVLAIILLLGFAYYDYRGYEGYRLGVGTGTLNPNSIGMVAVSVIAAAFAFRFGIIRLFLLVTASWVIYVTGSRASGVAAIAMVGAISWHEFRHSSRMLKFLVIIPLVAIALIMLVLHWETFYQALDSFFLWDDSHRGVATGGSGRTLIWAAMWEIIREHLVLGVGFRAHTELLKVGTSAHNGYLAMLADVGIIGFSIIMILIAYRCWKLGKGYFKSQDHLNAIFTAFLAGFLLLAMFERYLINIGNPTSLLFLFLLLGTPKSTLAVSRAKSRLVIPRTQPVLVAPQKAMVKKS